MTTIKRRHFCHYGCILCLAGCLLPEIARGETELSLHANALAYAKPDSDSLSTPRVGPTEYMNRQQREPLAPRPEIYDVEHFDIDYDKHRYAGHPQQGVFNYYGNGEIVIGYNRAPCNYELETDVSHGPRGYHGRAEVVLRRSLDYGRTWPEDQEVVIYRECDPPEKKRAFLFQPDAKRDQINMFSPDSLFFFTRSWLPELKGNLVCACMRSADRGRTWEKAPTVIPNPLVKNGDVLKSSYPVLRLPDGHTLLMTGAMNMPDAPKHSGPVLFRSSDKRAFLGVPGLGAWCPARTGRGPVQLSRAAADRRRRTALLLRTHRTRREGQPVCGRRCSQRDLHDHLTRQGQNLGRPAL